MELKRARNIVLRPVLSEKSLIKHEKGVLCFRVATDANKIEIKEAIEKLFSVKVEKVRTMNFQGKLRRFRFAPGRMADWKKAYVVLKEGEQPINFEDYAVKD